MNDYCWDNFKASNAFLSTFALDSRPFDRTRKNKTKKQDKEKRSSINPATRINTIEIDIKRKKKKYVSEIIYYNYNKKKYYKIKSSEF